jgi:hypothetical protein
MDPESIEYGLSVDCAREYLRGEGRQKILKVFEAEHWNVEIHRSGWPITAKQRGLDKWGNTDLNLTSTFTIEKDFSAIRFRWEWLDEEIMRWLPGEVQFCTFTFRKLEVEELPDYMARAIQNNCNALRARLTEHKHSF